MKKRLNKKVFTHIVLPIILLLALIFIGYSSLRKTEKSLSEEEAIVRAESFINNVLMKDGSKASVKEISSEYGLYKLKVDVVSDVVESYLTKDGKLFFPQALVIDNLTTNSGPSVTPPPQAATTVSKNKKPSVELFVMSYCPYGTQTEKGFLPVVEALGDKIDFKVKFVDYIMHGEEELNENLLQYCVQQEQPDKFVSYLSCFLKDGNSENCLSKTKINKKKVGSCVAKTDKKYKITENYENKVGYRGRYPGFDINKEAVSKYGVSGSPTIIINGAKVQSNRDPASLLKTVCGAFTDQPKECQTELPSASPSPGFGSGTTQNKSASTCN